MKETPNMNTYLWIHIFWAQGCDNFNLVIVSSYCKSNLTHEHNYKTFFDVNRQQCTSTDVRLDRKNSIHILIHSPGLRPHKALRCSDIGRRFCLWSATSRDCVKARDNKRQLQDKIPAFRGDGDRSLIPSLHIYEAILCLDTLLTWGWGCQLLPRRLSPGQFTAGEGWPLKLQDGLC